MQITKDIIEKINPNAGKGVSNKYSYNLYKFMKKQKQPWLGLSKFYWFDCHIYFGYLDGNFLTGNMVNRIRYGDCHSFAYVIGKKPIKEYKNFMQQYIDIGRCVFDIEHCGYMTNIENRYTIINAKTKQCNWCGKKLKLYKHKIISYETEWRVVS